MKKKALIYLVAVMMFASSWVGVFATENVSGEEGQAVDQSQQIDQEELFQDGSRNAFLFHALAAPFPRARRLSSRSLNTMFRSTVNTRHSSTMKIAWALA